MHLRESRDERSRQPVPVLRAVEDRSALSALSAAAGARLSRIRARRPGGGCTSRGTISRAMHRIEPARLKPGVTLDQLPQPSTAVTADDRPRALVRGRALIFWDPKAPPGTKKLDAIDTDQITPAADCVSESLETLDERWKAGSFRYLMPDFRARVHRGETFLIAGDRFAIGSSREMSPAGLKGVAEEVGREMVIICGHNMGDIFRRNAFNLGLHVVQCPEAVADARDGDEFTFDPLTRAIANVTQGKAYQPVPLSPKEEEIRRSGGIFAVGRREFRASVGHPPGARLAIAGRVSRDMTSTEQIVWAHRVDRAIARSDLRPGATLRVYADLLPASDGTAPFAIHTFNQITGGQTIYPAAGGDRQRSLRLHRQGRRRKADVDRPRVRARSRPGEAVLRDARRRHLPFLFSGAGAGPAGPVHSRRRLAQPRLRRVRRRRHRRRLDDARFRLVDGLRLLHARAVAARRLHRAGSIRGSAARTSCSSLLRRWGAKQSQGMSVEFVDRDRQLPMVSRNTIANMMAEAEALNGIFAPDEVTTRVVSPRRASPSCRIRRSRRARTRSTRSTRRSTWRRGADDREAVQSGQCVSRPRKSRASASRSTRR